LLQAIPSGCRLLLLGDADQLPPVDGAGVFADLAELFAIRLQTNHRMQNSNLHRFFEAARMGDSAPLLEILEPLPEDPIAWLEQNNFEHTRLICALRKGPLGVDALNQRALLYLQERLSFGQNWTAPILITSNDGAQKLYNGTPGVVRGTYRGGVIPYGSEEVLLSDGRLRLLRQLPGYEFAFALSAHKSQGSEFDRVLCLLSPGSEEFCREALYTALTRAKREIRLAGSKEVLEKMLSKTMRSENGIKERLATASL